MAAASQLQALLRFLSQDAKIPLAAAMTKVAELQQANLKTPEQISKAELPTLQNIFKDNKVAKQVLNAAKRVSKKREAPTETTKSPQKKQRQKNSTGSDSPFETESALALPVSSASEAELSNMTIVVNRAPLVLAFAVCVLKYTMPEQPISSRLSLAQAAVSANSRSKAVSLGLESGKPAEQEGWGEGQPGVNVLGREVKVLKRWDYNPREGEPTGESRSQDVAVAASENVLGQPVSEDSDSLPPLWGVDLEALRSSHDKSASGDTKASKPLPIFTPESARSYLLKSFSEFTDESNRHLVSPKRKSTSQIETERETCLGHILRAIDIVCQSWASTLSKDELDRRAWTWYVRVRPDVKIGREGWGQKDSVKLSDILALQR
ncbi:hypothetical protein PHISCL_06731 [Aspergillus sclerotialis]|uniref:Uncharacterized protein n=1 Tax=Aspergillus sclerotialis TaxID=2070753 RepID=A0A3A2ZCS8_9EURO|nr:hypothetical protein PHISCL_06731 [Aspergillus sclerotialis]